MKNTHSKHFNDVDELCASLKEDADKLQLPLSDVQPNFARFDTETKEEKQEAYIDFLAHQRLREKTAQFFRPIKIAALVFATLGLLLGIAYGISCIPKSINREYTGAKYRIGATATIEKVDIRIEEKLDNRLFHNPNFTGKVVISGVDISEKYEAIISFFNDGFNKKASLVYSGIHTEQNTSYPYLHNYAMVYADTNFNYCIFLIFEPEGADQGSTTNLVIAAPAQNVEEGSKLIEKLKLNGVYPFNSGYLEPQ